MTIIYTFLDGIHHFFGRIVSSPSKADTELMLENARLMTRLAELINEFADLQGLCIQRGNPGLGFESAVLTWSLPDGDTFGIELFGSNLIDVFQLGKNSWAIETTNILDAAKAFVVHAQEVGVIHPMSTDEELHYISVE